MPTIVKVAAVMLLSFGFSFAEAGSALECKILYKRELSLNIRFDGQRAAVYTSGRTFLCKLQISEFEFVKGPKGFVSRLKTLALEPCQVRAGDAPFQAIRFEMSDFDKRLGRKIKPEAIITLGHEPSYKCAPFSLDTGLLERSFSEWKSSNSEAKLN